MNYYTEDETLDRVLGAEGTPLREQYDSKLQNFLMKSLAEYAIKEHRAGRCISQDQVENDIMKSMGWKQTAVPLLFFVIFSRKSLLFPIK